MRSWFAAAASNVVGLDERHRHEVELRQAAATSLVGRRTPAAVRIQAAPPAYLLAHGPNDVARHCALLSPGPAAGEARVVVTPGLMAGEWKLDVAGRDRPGLLADFTGVLADVDVEVIQAVLATWDDGAALEAFTVRANSAPAADELQARFEASLGDALSSPPVADAEITFAEDLSPLYTSCAMRAADRPGLLHAFAVAIAFVGGDVHAARVTTTDGIADDYFDLSDRAGRKLTPAMRAAITAAVAGGVDIGRTRRRAAVR